MVWNARKRNYSEYDGQEIPKDHATKKAKAKTSASAKSPEKTPVSYPTLSLLGLPGELRNHIFELALTAPSRHVFLLPRSPHQRSCEQPHQHNTQPHAFNQLKNVCRQLRSETADLGLRYNDVLIDHASSLAPTLARCTPKQQASMNFSLHYEKLEDTIPILRKRWISPVKWDDLVEIARFCRKHPHIHVAITFADFKYPTSSKKNHDPLEYFLATAMYISMVYRRIDLTRLLPKAMAARPMYGITARDVVLDNGVSFGKTWPVPVDAVNEFEAENMRFFPRWKGRREGVVNRIAKGWAKAHRREGGDGDDWREVCEAEVRRWFEKGI